MKKNKRLIVVAGPTASGKTALAVKLAEALGTEIISADSRQFYREMSIGTAKPSKEEMKGIRHHFIDSHSIQEEYNIGRYEKEALQTIEHIFQTHDTAVMVGGSGLYIQVVCEGMDEIPDTSPHIREALMQKLETEGLNALLEELEARDPIYHAQVDRSNTHRIIRALEVIHATGAAFSDFRKGEKKERPFDIVKIGLLWDRQELYERIDLRMEEMIRTGLFEEAVSLYPYRHHNALQTVGYKEIFDYMEGKYDREEAIRLLKRNSRRYAKRQMTWFNRDRKMIWVDASRGERLAEEVIGMMDNKF